MTARTVTHHQAETAMPDLPLDLFGEADALYESVPRPGPRPARPTSRPGRQRQPRPEVRRAPVTQDTVTSVRMREESHAVPLRMPSIQLSKPTITMPVMPSLQLIGEQALPNLVMTLSALAVIALGMFTPFGLPVWAVGLFVPTVALAIRSSSATHVLWRRSALINLATVILVFPVLVIRQSVIRVPFVDGGNGTMMAPVIATIAVVGILAVMAVICAVISQEDPEYAGILFLPAAMMVPFLAGQSDLVNLSSALWLVVLVFAMSAVLTVLTSFLPGKAAAFVAPAAIGMEFILLTVFRTESVFPTGAGNTAKVLFAVVVVATVGLTILVPMLSNWVRQVTRIAQSPGTSRTTTPPFAA